MMKYLEYVMVIINYDVMKDNKIFRMCYGYNTT